VTDDCDDCVDPADFNGAMDCAGVCDGTFVTDECDDCVDPEDFNGAMDCAGVCDGSYVTDDCDDCVDPADFNGAMDCAGVCDGSAYMDECDVCDDDPANDNLCFGVDVSIGVAAGWNWFSLNVTGDNMDLTTVLSNLGEDQVYIKNQSLFAEYYGDFGWFGGLETIGNTDFYMLQTLASGAILYNGMPVDVANTPIDLFTGWNWVGYTPQGAQEINVALDGISENGVYVKNQTAFSEYYSGFGWFGGLGIMSPFDGYMLQMTSEDVLVYPDTGPAFTGVDHLQDDVTQLFRDNAAEWQVNPYDYQYNGSVTALITINGDPQATQYDILGAFVGDECRGITTGLYFPITGETVFMIMVFSNQTVGEELSFRFYDSSMDMYYGFEGNVGFQVNMTVGSAIDPYQMDNSYLLGINDTQPTKYALDQAYPNPFNPMTTIRYSVKELGNVDISIYDMIGREVARLVDDIKAPGTYQIVWDANKHPSGIYFVKMTSGYFTTTQKLMLVK